MLGKRLVSCPDTPLPTMHAVAQLQTAVALKDVGGLVLTHLTPKRMPSLRALLQRLSQARAGSLDVHLSNPALQLLRSSLGEAMLGGTGRGQLPRHAAASTSGKQMWLLRCRGMQIGTARVCRYFGLLHAWRHQVRAKRARRCCRA